MSKSKPALTFFIFSLLIFFLSALIYSSCLFAQAPSEETLTVTTYYPAPYGVYNEMRAKRMAIGDNWFNATSYCWAADPSCGPDNIDANADLVVEGNVGIGTPNPAAFLDLQGNSSVTIPSTPLLKITDTRLSSGILVPLFQIYGRGLSSTYKSLQIIGAGSISQFDTNGVQRSVLELTSLVFYNGAGVEATRLAGSGPSYFAGNVGIGASPSGTYKLEVAGDVGATAYWYTSDERLKTNIHPTPGLEIIGHLRGVSFNWKENGHQSAGLLAQDVERALPQAVATDASTGMKSLNYGALTAPIVESIKELKAAGDDKDERLRTLEAEVSGLKRQIEQLKAKGAQR